MDPNTQDPNATNISTPNVLPTIPTTPPMDTTTLPINSTPATPFDIPPVSPTPAAPPIPTPSVTPLVTSTPPASLPPVDIASAQQDLNQAVGGLGVTPPVVTPPTPSVVAPITPLPSTPVAQNPSLPPVPKENPDLTQG